MSRGLLRNSIHYVLQLQVFSQLFVTRNCVNRRSRVDQLNSHAIVSIFCPFVYAGGRL